MFSKKNRKKKKKKDIYKSLHEVQFQLPDSPFVCTGIYVDKTDFGVYTLLSDGTTTTIPFDYVLSINEINPAETDIHEEHFQFLRCANDYAKLEIN